VLAAGVHLLTVALVVVAVTVSVLSPTFPAFVLSLLLLAVAFFVRPRFGRVPRDGVVLTRTGAPELYRLLDRVAEETGARRVDLVVADPHFNAAYGGHRTGAPADRQDRASPVERADPGGAGQRSRARDGSCGEWGQPPPADRRDGSGKPRTPLFPAPAGEGLEERYAGSFVALLALVIRLAKWVLRLPVAGTYLALSMLTMRAGQRAEYLADRLAAATASPAAAGDALDKVRTVEETLLPAISYQAAFPTRVHLWSKQRELIARIPAQELERRRRISAAAEHRVDTSHPPTHLRVALLRDLPDAEPKVSLAVKEVEAIEQELASAYEEVAVALAAPYRAAHYES
jgi:hypothetical protein